MTAKVRIGGIVRDGFGRPDVPPDFIADSLAGFYLLMFVMESGQKNLLRKSPAKCPNFYDKNPQHISAERPSLEFTFISISTGNVNSPNPHVL